MKTSENGGPVPNILVVEENPSHRHFLVEVLRKKGYLVRPAESGQAALAEALSHPPELVLLATGLPDMSGYELCERLKADERTRPIPVIFLSALASIPDKVKAFETGGVDFIAKPFEAEELLARLKIHLARHQTLEQKVARLEQELAERRQLDEALRESEQRYRTLFENVPVGTGLATPDGQVISCNRMMQAMTGYTAAELKSLNLRDLYENPDDRTVMLARLQKDGLVRDFETTLKQKDGLPFPVSITISPIILAGEQVLLTVLRDISARVQAEEEVKSYQEQLEALVAARTVELQQEIDERRRVEEMLREREAAFNKAQELAGLGSFEWDLTDDTLKWSENMFAIAGLDSESFAGNLQQVSADIIHPDDQERVQRHVAEMMHSRKTWPMEFRIVRPDGQERLLRSGSEFIFDQAGLPVKCIGVHFDVTEQKRTEVALWHSEERYRALVNASPGSIMVLQDGRYVFSNPAGARMLGLSDPNEVVGMSALARIAPDFRDLVVKWMNNLAAGAANPPLELKLLRPDGTSLWVESTSVAINFQGESATLIIGQDITDRKQAEETLWQSEERYRTMFQAASVSLWEQDISDLKLALNELKAEGVTNLRAYLAEHPDFVRRAIQKIKVVDVNDRTLELYGANKKEELLGCLEKTVAPEALPDFKEQLLAIAAEQPYFERESLARTLTGETINIILSVTIPPASAELNRMLVSVTDITARKKTEQALRESEERFRSYFELPLIGIAITSSEKRWLEVNDRLCDILGYAREELIGLAWTELTHPDDLAANLAHVERMVAGECEGYSMEKRFIRRDGSTVHTEISVRCVRQSDGAAAYFVAVAQDITERKQAEEALRRSEATLKSIFRVAPIGIGLVSNRVLKWTNDTLHRMVGYSGDELAGQSARMLYENNAEFERVGREKYAEIAERGTGSIETRFRRKDGSVIEVLLSSTPLDPDDLSAGVTFTALDITERQKAVAEVKRRNRELAMLNRVIEASAVDQPAEKMLETACRELALAFDMPHAVAALLNEDKSQAVVVAEYVAPSQPSVLNLTFSIQDSQDISFIRDFFRFNRPLVVEDAKNDPRLVEIRDLIERRNIASLVLLPLIIEDTVAGSLSLNTFQRRYFTAEETELASRVAGQVAGALARIRLTDTRRRLMAAIEQTPESVVITDIEGDIVYVNPAFEQITGYSRAEALGRNPRLLKSGRHDTAFYEELWDTISTGQVWQGQMVNRKKDGTHYTEEAIITPVRDEQGTIVNYIAIKRDVTLELQLEEQYRQAQRLESIGRLAGGVAHDFNNILTVITGYSELLLGEYFSPDDPRREEMEEIRHAAERAGILTRQLLAFSRQQRLKLQVLNLNEVIKNLEKMLRRLIGEDIILVTNLAPDLGQIETDPGQMEQVLMNLAVNARDAMPRGGQLILETASITSDQIQGAEQLELTAAAYTRLTVTDTGIGMDDQVRAHIFEPFFTTKETGKGTGLGLATVYGIVQQSGGHIFVESAPGQGAAFTMYLPQVEPKVGPVASAWVSAAALTGAETILVVEDETPVRLITTKMLETRGYTVLATDGAETALSLSQEYQAKIDLLIADVIMPDMSGIELAEHLQQLLPNLKVLFMSGYSNEELDRYGVPAHDIHLLEKPFSSEALARKVREILDATERP